MHIPNKAAASLLSNDPLKYESHESMSKLPLNLKIKMRTEEKGGGVRSTPSGGISALKLAHNRKDHSHDGQDEICNDHVYCFKNLNKFSGE